MPPLDVRFLLRASATPDVAGMGAEAPVSPAFARLLRRVTPEPPPCACGRCGACEARLQEERREFHRQRELNKDYARERGGDWR